MTPQALLERLVELFRDFRAHWDDPLNCWRDDDGSFNTFRVFAEFTAYVRERHAGLARARVKAVGDLVSECMSSADVDLDNAAATCIRENMAGEPCEGFFLPY
jgi:hypothetical protein